MTTDNHYMGNQEDFDTVFKRPPATLSIPPFTMRAIERQVGGSHYKVGGNNMQPWDIVDAWGLDFYEGSVLSYLLRSRYKGTRLADLQKIRHYIDKMIEDADNSANTQ